MESIPHGPSLTPREYLEGERRADSKSEYWEGRLYSMGGASFRHNRLVANLITSLGTQLRGGLCAVYASDLRIANLPGTRFFYPDVSVLCGPPQAFQGEPDIAVNPTLLIEVLSESTAACDRGPKFLAYQALASLQEYLLVSQDDPMIEHYLRQPAHSWLYTNHDQMEGRLELPSVGASLSLREIYQDV